ncbi:hypothetical protein A8B98_04535 [Hymenobacter sp. UV11]|nr:hypothetical protein A8B98_04535 [Hymenobacter sp. UV11]
MHRPRITRQHLFTMRHGRATMPRRFITAAVAMGEATAGAMAAVTSYLSLLKNTLLVAISRVFFCC